MGASWDCGDERRDDIAGKLADTALAVTARHSVRGPSVERELVIQALKETNGNQVQAAKLLGITRATLRKRIEKFEIQRELSLK